MLAQVRNYLKNYIDKNYPEWDISIALRYCPIAEDLKKIHQEGESIVEIGSEITGITTYLKKAVIGIDTDFDYSKKNKYLAPLKGSALNLPLKDKTADYVLSVDMLEHIPPDKRSKAISEMVRITKQKLYLSCPCDKKSEEIDKNLDDYYHQKHGRRYPYLKEHLEYGLPRSEEIKAQLQKYKGFKLRVYGNTNCWLWLCLLKLGFSNHKFKCSLYRRMLVLFPILKHFHFGKTYRKLFILERIDK